MITKAINSRYKTLKIQNTKDISIVLETSGSSVSEKPQLNETKRGLTNDLCITGNMSFKRFDNSVVE